MFVKLICFTPRQKLPEIFLPFREKRVKRTLRGTAFTQGYLEARRHYPEVSVGRCTTFHMHTNLNKITCLKKIKKRNLGMRVEPRVEQTNKQNKHAPEHAHTHTYTHAHVHARTQNRNKKQKTEE